MIDPRGPRLAAVVTTVVLAAVLITGSAWLLALQAVVFAVAVLRGPSRSPYGYLYIKLVRPRLKPPAELEDPMPPRFAQAVGLGFSVIGLAGYLSGVTAIAYVAVGAALAAAFLNAAFGFCLGCEVYLAYRRIVSARSNNTPEVTP
ncbi:DUF4395 domain-containing protein [Phytoactinopolyspora endophytica]|uniref:DUF4395 domain-containing protein n=1 Tax=Phytoactinopolyspora endophytica TaxID=1642495 RepID=UPI00101E1F7A|nr:DUF4395 domain-containing protein [Phytoactinopolyspora endophytica]